MVTSAQVQELAYACGFEIAGVTAALPHADFDRFESWRQEGKAAELAYLTDHRGDLRSDPRNLLPTARSIICLGKLYNTDQPLSTETLDASRGWISRYAWGFDYHDVLREPLEELVRRLTARHGKPFESRLCIDTAPLLERSYARAAGLGWIGKNTCLINQERGSWFFLAELLVSLEIAPDAPVTDRCGSCSRCIEACPTEALVPNLEGGYDLDARLCISYLTIEKRGVIPSELSALHGQQVFGCDICQDVCPWNSRAHRQSADLAGDTSFAAQIFAPDLTELAEIDPDEFRIRFRRTPIWRTKYEGFLRNVAIAMGNSGKVEMREPLKRLAGHPSATISETAHAALARLESLLSHQLAGNFVSSDPNRKSACT